MKFNGSMSIESDTGEIKAFWDSNLIIAPIERNVYFRGNTAEEVLEDLATKLGLTINFVKATNECGAV